MPPSRVLVAEDYQEWRRQIRSLLGGHPEIEIVCEVADGAQAVEKALELTPDVILMDIGLPVLNGIEASRRIHEANPRLKIIFLSQEKSSDVVEAALDTGAMGYLNKADAAAELTRAIDAVLEGLRFISRSLEPVGTELREARSAGSHEVLFCFDDDAIVRGLSRFAAAALGASEPVIVVATKPHCSRLMEKLECRGLDMKSLVQQRIFISLDADTACCSAQFFAIVEAAAQCAFEAAGKPSRISLCGERAGRLWAQGKIDEALELEGLCTQLLASHQVRILCLYPWPQLQEPPGLETVCRQHTGARYC